MKQVSFAKIFGSVLVISSGLVGVVHALVLDQVEKGIPLGHWREGLLSSAVTGFGIYLFGSLSKD